MGPALERRRALWGSGGQDRRRRGGRLRRRRRTPQADGAQRAGGGLVGKQPLTGQLGGPIGAHWRGLVLLVDRLAVAGAVDLDGGGKHQPYRLAQAAGSLGQPAQQVDRAAEIGVV